MMILGSGLGSLADRVENPIIIKSSELPGWPVSTVLGHEGKLVFGNLEGQYVLSCKAVYIIMKVTPWIKCTLPIRVMQRLGIPNLIVTNAAGAIDPDYSPGDLMLITDHIAMIGMAGLNPLRGPNMEEFGLRFPDIESGLRPWID